MSMEDKLDDLESFGDISTLADPSVVDALVNSR